MKKLTYYIPGVLLILAALLIMAVPEILVAFIAASVGALGIAVLYVGHLIRKSEIEFERMERSDLGGTWFTSPLFSSWFGYDPFTGWRLWRL